MTAPDDRCSCGGVLTVLDRAHVAVRIDTAIYSQAAILRATYKLTDRAFIFLSQEAGQVVAYLLGRAPADDVTAAAGELANELIDQQLRVHLEQQFGTVRDLITAQAFAEGNLLAPGRDDADYNDDPDGISRPR